MKTKTYPQFFIDGRRARTLRNELGMPDTLNKLDEDTVTEVTSLPLSIVAEALNLPRIKYDYLAGPEAFLCGGALTAWIGGYPPTDYDFFFPHLEAAQRFHEELLRRRATLEGYQGSQAGQDIFEQIQKGELRIDELVREVIDNEEIRALNYSVPTGEKPDLIQIVLLIQGEDPPAVINTFDFTISMLGTDRRNLHFGKYTWTDLFRKRLRVHHIHHGISTMRRMVKYSHRGFYSCVGTMREVAQGVIDSPSDQPISVD
jgi:hypothetical protein